MDALDAAWRRYPVGDQVDARVTYVPEPGVIGLFIELDDGHQGFVDVVHLPYEPESWPQVER
jgi:ribosomal protein S1